MAELEFRVTDEAQALELQGKLKELFGVEVSVRAEGADGGFQKGEPSVLSAIAVLMMLPSTINNTLDLVRRAELGKKVEALKAWARGQSSDVTVTAPGLGPCKLPDTEAGAILDAMVEASKQDGTK
ncbi:MAG: hypothetical protein AAF533_24665 [Acidobacteriota bacterium]